MARPSSPPEEDSRQPIHSRHTMPDERRRPTAEKVVRVPTRLVRRNTTHPRPSAPAELISALRQAIEHPGRAAGIHRPQCHSNTAKSSQFCEDHIPAAFQNRKAFYFSQEHGHAKHEKQYQRATTEGHVWLRDGGDASSMLWCKPSQRATVPAAPLRQHFSSLDFIHQAVAN